MKLYLIFQAGGERYACLCDPITEIIPLVSMKKSPHLPEYFAGFINYGGRQVPVIDWCQLMLQRPSKKLMHTRIILFNLSEQESEQGPTMGLIAEQITNTMSISPDTFTTCAVDIKEIPYLKGVNNQAKGTIQLVDITKLFEVIRNEMGEHV